MELILILNTINITEEYELINSCDKYGRTGLYLACDANQLKCVKLLLSHKSIDVNKANNDGYTPLNRACCDGHVEIVRLLLNRKDIDVNKANNREYTPLNNACIRDHRGRKEVIKLLLNRNDIDVNKAASGDNAPYYSAYTNGRTEICTLLAAHPDIEIDDIERLKYGRRAFLAVNYGIPVVVVIAMGIGFICRR